LLYFSVVAMMMNIIKESMFIIISMSE